MHTYEVHIRGQLETLKIVEMPDEALINRYGKYAEEKGIDPVDVKPTIMFMRDYACSTGAFSWSDYTKLQPRNYKKKEVN